MASRERLEWLQVVGINEVRLFNPGRMRQLVEELRNPAHQRPSFYHFVGQRTKDRALRELFPENNFKKIVCEGVATLRVDNATTYSDSPVFFAESSPNRAIPIAVEDPRACETESFPVQWAEYATGQRFNDVLHARLFCLFVDVVCIFADDFEDFDQVVQLLESWAAAGSASVHFNRVRPRVIIVRRKDEASPSSTYDILTMEGLQQGLHHDSLKKFFSSTKVLHLAAEQLSPLARFRRLKELLRREMDEMRNIRRSLGCLYSALHVSSFFHMAVAHTASSLTERFDFVLASRRDHEVQPDFADHLSRLLRVGESRQAPRDALMTFAASSILLDAYPPNMHGKDAPPFHKLAYLTKLGSL